MQLIFNKKNDQTQAAEFSCSMTEAELNFLVNFAIESLIQIGAIAVEEKKEGPQEVQLPLGSIPAEHLS